MKQLILLITVALLIAVLLSACGPSEEEQNATGTAIAAGIFATQTAEAPTVTPTPTNTATPTETPTPVPTFTPTPPPEPTETPAPTPEPTTTAELATALAAALPVTEDLPSGFQELPSGFMDSTLGVGTQEAIGPNVTFVNPATSEFIIAFLSPMESGIQRSVFEEQIEDPAALVNMMGLGFQASGAVDAEVEYEDLTELSEIGEKAGGIRSLVELEGTTFIYDVILFLRDDVGTIVGVLHPEVVETELDVREVARLVDGRLVQLSGEPGGDASGPAEIEVDGDAGAGQTLFEATCAECHGSDGKGLPKLGNDLTSSDFVAGSSDFELMFLIASGRSVSDPANMSGRLMPPMGGNPELTEQDLRDVVAYMRTILQ